MAQRYVGNPDFDTPTQVSSPEISQAPLSSGEKTVLWLGGLAALAAFAWVAFKPEEKASDTAPQAPTPTGPLPPAMSCLEAIANQNKLFSWAATRGYYVLFVKEGSVPDYYSLPEAVKAQPLPLLFVDVTAGHFWTYEEISPDNQSIVLRDDLRTDYCKSLSALSGQPAVHPAMAFMSPFFRLPPST